MYPIKSYKLGLADIIMSNSSMFMLFYYLDPLQNQAIMTSLCMHYTFCRGRKVKQADESVLLPVTEKEGKGKGNEWTIGPRMKNGRANLCLFWAQTNGRSCVLKLSFLFACTMSAIYKSFFQSVLRNSDRLSFLVQISFLNLRMFGLNTKNVQYLNGRK